MAKFRVYQLAKELRVQSALILELLDRMGQEVKSDLSVLDENTAELVRARVTRAIEAEKKRLAEEQRLHPEEIPEPAEIERPVEEEQPAEEPAPLAAAVAAEEIAPALWPAPAVPAERSAPLPAAARPSTVPRPAPPARPAAAKPAAGVVAPPAVIGPPGARPPRVFPARRQVPLKTPVTRTARPVPGALILPRPPAPAVPGRPVPPPVAAKGKRRKRDREREVVPAPARPRPDLPPVPKEITLSEAVTVKELAEKLNRKSKDVIAKLITRGVLANINQPLDPEVAIGLAKEFGSEARVITFEEEAQRAPAVPEPSLGLALAADRPEDVAPRPPVVTVMGHVDHGKTSLLDAIREANVAAGEAGGITQHIGAYQVEKKGRKVTFLDTPGHEAFTLMRSRGSKATDIVVLVVAADDGVKPQTLEAIDHARAAGVPIVVAINKIDKPNAQVGRVKQQLAEQGIVIEEYGGDVVSCEISAKQRTGIAELLEMILLVADMKELKANAARPGAGVVLETKLDRTRGIVATVLVQDGTLRVGDPFIAGAASGKVRAMSDEHGRRVESAGPATPVEVIGFDGEPQAGDTFQTVAEEAKARQIASFRQEKARAEAQVGTARRTLESLARDVAQGELKELPIILKADSQGSAEALQKSLEELPQDKIRVRVIRASIGAITRADVLLGSASNAIVVGFNVRPDRGIADLAKQEEIEVRLYTVIYDLINDVKRAMLGMLEPTFKETVLGQAEVRQLFKVPKVGMVAGCFVIDGRVARSAEVRLLRDNVVVYTGRVGSLRRFKEDVSEVKQGFECGIGIANYNDLKEGDVIEFFATEKIAAQSL
jgi:translation initiation factor IF-2